MQLYSKSTIVVLKVYQLHVDGVLYSTATGKSTLQLNRATKTHCRPGLAALLGDDFILLISFGGEY